MPPLILDRRRAVLALFGLATLSAGIAATVPASRIYVSSARWRINANDDGTQLYEGVVIKQAPGTLISADRARGTRTGNNHDSSDWEDNSQWVLTGKVHIEHKNAVLDADTATVVFAGGLVQSIEVHGMPAKFFHPGKAAGQRFDGTADTINFDGAQGQVRFTGRPWFSRAGIGEGNSAKPLVYDVGSGALRSEPGSNTDAPILVVFGEDRRIEGRFDGSFRLGTEDGTVAGERVTITQGDGMRITAASAAGSWSGSVADSRWTLSGKVHIESDRSVLDAATATVVFASQLIQSIDVRGTPASFLHPGKVAGRPYTGTAEAIAYDGTQRLVRFTGQSWFSYGTATGNSRKPLIYDINTGVLHSEKDGNTDLPAIRATINKDRVPTPRTPDRSKAQ